MDINILKENQKKIDIVINEAYNNPDKNESKIYLLTSPRSKYKSFDVLL